MKNTTDSEDLLSTILGVFPDSDSGTAYERLMSIDTSRSKALSKGGLVLTDQGLQEHTQNPDGNGGGEKVIPDAVIAHTFKLRFGNALTGAETRLLRKLISGKSLKEISEEDGVSYQTRRNQMKTLMEKAGTSRQTVLIASMSALLTVQATRSKQTEAAAQSVIREFLEVFYPGSTRVYSPRLRDGNELLVLDIGPTDGQPVVYLHSSFFPVFPFPMHLATLDDLNMRIIIPIRPGFFGVPVDWTVQPNRRYEVFAKSLAEFQMDFGLENAPVLAHAHGSLAAVELCSLLNGSTSQLYLHAAQYAPGLHKMKQPVHIRALMRIIDRSPRAGMAIYKTLSRAVLRPSKLDETLSKLFSDSAPDLAKLRDPEFGPWLHKLLHGMGTINIEGIVSDIQMTKENWIEPLCRLPIPVQLIYGSDDPYANYQNLDPTLSNNRISVRVVEGEGMLSMLFEPETLLAMLKEHA